MVKSTFACCSRCAARRPDMPAPMISTLKSTPGLVHVGARRSLPRWASSSSSSGMYAPMSAPPTAYSMMRCTSASDGVGATLQPPSRKPTRTCSASSLTAACCSSVRPPCGMAKSSGSGRSSSRRSDRSPVAYASAGSSGGSSASSRMARSSSSDAVLGAISLMNGLAEDAAVVACSPMDGCHSLRCLLAHEAEQVAGDAPHLDLLGALGDAGAAVVAVDVLERLVARVAEAAVHLHGAVGGVAAQSVADVVAHRYLLADGERAVGVHLPRRLVDQRAQHVGLRLQLHERELDALVGGERLAERLALLRVLDRLVDAVLRGAERRRGLADAVLVEEHLRDGEALALATEDRAVRDAHVGEPHVGVVRRHVERPEELDDLEAGGVGRRQERGDAVAVAGLAARAGEDQVVLGAVHARVPRLLAVDDP